MPYTVGEMAKKSADQRPPPKDKKVNTRVPQDVYEAAEAKAKKRGSTLSKMIRAFLVLFANDETPEGWPPEVTEHEIRAAKRKKK